MCFRFFIQVIPSYTIHLCLTLVPLFKLILDFISMDSWVYWCHGQRTSGILGYFIFFSQIRFLVSIPNSLLFYITPFINYGNVIRVAPLHIMPILELSIVIFLTTDGFKLLTLVDLQLYYTLNWGLVTILFSYMCSISG